MNTRPLLAALAGGFTVFVLGYITYVVILASFVEANMGSAIGVYRTETGNLMLHYILLGEVALAYLLVLVFNKTSSVSDVWSGARVGAQVGFLLGLGVNLVQLGSMNIGKVARAKSTSPSATATAEPELEPPGTRSDRRGFTGVP